MGTPTVRETAANQFATEMAVAESMPLETHLSTTKEYPGGHNATEAVEYASHVSGYFRSYSLRKELLESDMVAVRLMRLADESTSDAGIRNSYSEQRTWESMQKSPYFKMVGR